MSQYEKFSKFAKVSQCEKVLTISTEYKKWKTSRQCKMSLSMKNSFRVKNFLSVKIKNVSLYEESFSALKRIFYVLALKNVSQWENRKGLSARIKKVLLFSEKSLSATENNSISVSLSEKKSLCVKNPPSVKKPLRMKRFLSSKKTFSILEKFYM